MFCQLLVPYLGYRHLLLVPQEKPCDIPYHPTGAEKQMVQKPRFAGRARQSLKHHLGHNASGKDDKHLPESSMAVHLQSWHSRGGGRGSVQFKTSIGYVVSPRPAWDRVRPYFKKPSGRTLCVETIRLWDFWDYLKNRINNNKTLFWKKKVKEQFGS